jgi:hypothetical protein
MGRRHHRKGNRELAGARLRQTCRSVLASCLFSQALLLVLLTAPLFGQDLPNSVHGYKVYKDKITLSVSSATDDRSDASVDIGEPNLVEFALTGITFELPAKVRSGVQSGKVDFLTFREVRVNGIAVEVEEYRHPFAFKKGEPVTLPKPARIFLPVNSMIQAAWNEMRDSKADWTVSGRVFVFGRFRRLGMYHKRVVPVDFEIKIKNPLSNN